MSPLIEAIGQGPEPLRVRGRHQRATTPPVLAEPLADVPRCASRMGVSSDFMVGAQWL